MASADRRALAVSSDRADHPPNSETEKAEKGERDGEDVDEEHTGAGETRPPLRNESHPKVNAHHCESGREPAAWQPSSPEFSSKYRHAV